MTSDLSPKPLISLFGFRGFRPFRDAAVATFVILFCLAGSELWVYDLARRQEMSHHQEAVASAARRVAEEFNRKLLAAGAGTPAERAKALAKLRELESSEALVSRLAIIAPTDTGHLVLFDTSLSDQAQAAGGSAIRRPVTEEDRASIDAIEKDPKDLAIVHPDGTVKVYVPIQERGKVTGVVSAESAIHTLEAGLASIRFATTSSLTIGSALALLVGAWVYWSRRKSSLAALRLARAESADRLIVDALGEIFYEHNIPDDTITWRGATTRILGTAPGNLAPTGLDWQERIHPADRETYREARHRLVSGQLFSVEYRVTRDDGRFIWLLDRGGMMPSSEDAPAIAIGVMLDVSESREAQQRLRDVVDAAGEYIWEVDELGRYTYVSDRARDVLGYSPEAMLGERPVEFVPLDQREYVLETSNALSEERCAFRDFEHQFVRSDGTVIWISVNGVPAFDANGNWCGYRGAGLDITARKESAQALIREKEAANAAVQAKSQFLAMMSHEIRTPLNSVLGFADLLAESSLLPTQREHVEIIRNSGDALLVLLNDILDFSRLESARLAIDIGSVNLRDCLQQVLDLYRPAVEQKKIALTLEIDSLVPKYLQTDRARLRQILLNLVGNAVKFTEEGSINVRVTVRSTQSPDSHGTIRIEVSDTGIGIPENKQGLLFQPFSQVDSSATRRFGGTGLGLAICKRLGELLGGVVGLKESGARGSCFYLNLPDLPAPDPVSSAAAEKPREPLFPVASGSFKAVRVLVVEDNRINRILAQKMLSSLGVESHSAENGQQCVDLHREVPFDIILMDVQMPLVDGLEATRLIRELDRHRPGVKPVVVALTADAMIGDRERCLAAGMDDYLSKPIRLDALAALIERYGLYSRE
ncbi:hypothetical protein BH09VER1_BH09VER1_06000 [soil metagenome]